MAKNNKNDRLAYGLSILIFGLIFLLSKTGILSHIPYGSEFMSIGAFFLISGIIFLLTSANKTLGIIFTLVGLIIKSDLFFGWIHSYSKLIVPILLIIVGLSMVLTSKK